MADLNNWSITGRLSKDAVIKELNGKTLLEMDVANNFGFGDYAKTNWVKVKMWGERGRNIVDLLKKGTQIATCGELSTNTWTTKEGESRTDLILTVSSINFVGSSKKSESNKPEDTDEAVF